MGDRNLVPKKICTQASAGTKKQYPLPPGSSRPESQRLNPHAPSRLRESVNEADLIPPSLTTQDRRNPAIPWAKPAWTLHRHTDKTQAFTHPSCLSQCKDSFIYSDHRCYGRKQRTLGHGEILSLPYAAIEEGQRRRWGC
jgi:hypothetical protein